MVALNLPAQPTPFIGRVAELDEITRLLADPACRLLTLVGAGGIGKTRLALELAHRVAANSSIGFPDGVSFVSLQPLSSPEFIVPAIAEAIHLKFYSSDEPKQQLLRELQYKFYLLVMDNFEHLLDGAPIVSEILAAAPGVKVVATSREALNLQEEWLFTVQGMAYPETADDIEDYSAVQLFAQNARRMRPDFSLDEEATGVRNICALVEGMPLALELAAAWVRVMSCMEIANEIRGGLDILETPARNVPPRHRNMRAVLEYSWGLLTDTQREVFQKLSVFQGSFTRQAAEAITGASLRTLSSLVDKSWLRWDPARRRYDLHELLRQYGDEQLRLDSAAWNETAERHCRYFAQFLEAQLPRLTGGQYQEAIADIETDFDNVRSSWNWAVEHCRQEEIEAAVRSLWYFFDTGGLRFQEGEQTFARAAAALEAAGLRDGRVRGRVLAYQGALCFSLVQYQKGMALLEEALRILRPLDAREDIAFCLLEIGMNINEHTRDILRARDYFHQSLTIYRELNHEWGIANVLSWLSVSHYEEAVEYGAEDGLQQAGYYAHEGYALYQKLNNVWGIAVLGITVASVAHLLGDYEQGWQYASESYRVFEQMGIQWGIPFSLFNMGESACGLGRYDDARRCALRALQVTTGYRSIDHSMLLLHLVAETCLGYGQTEKGYELLGLVDLQRQRLGLRRDRVGIRLLTRLDAELPPHLQAAVERGRMRDLDATFQEIISELSHEAGGSAARPHQPLIDPLTERELEILQLIAAGCTNREIADQLFLALGTVKFYNNQIFSKLQVGSRTQAIVRARELNLLA